MHFFIYHLVTWSLSNSACWFIGEAQNGRMFAGARVVNAGLGGVTESPPGGETPCSIGEFGTFGVSTAKLDMPNCVGLTTDATKYAGMT